MQQHSVLHWRECVIGPLTLQAELAGSGGRRGERQLSTAAERASNITRADQFYGIGNQNGKDDAIDCSVFI